tara:strand:+ start:4393 stop:5259 length:867 start_codon:yes stop_codon:yes gene_type:complete
MRFYTYFSRQQRLAVVLLILTIVSLELMLVLSRSTPPDQNKIDPQVYVEFQNEVDRLSVQKRNKSIPKRYPFNPNYITDYKGYTLGMSTTEINRLHQYRLQNKWVNSEKAFQQITKVSDSFLKTIAPYFKFPDWVTASNRKSTFGTIDNSKTVNQTIDLNKATAEQLQKVHGIGAFYSERIIRFRDSFEGGFISEIQLQDVHGLSSEVIENVLKYFSVKTPRHVKKLNLNVATADQLVQIQHIDYELAYDIVELRMLKEGYSAIEELTKVKGFPIEKLEIIKLYLSIN